MLAVVSQKDVEMHVLRTAGRVSKSERISSEEISRRTEFTLQKMRTGCPVHYYYHHIKSFTGKNTLIISLFYTNQSSPLHTVTHRMHKLRPFLVLFFIYYINIILVKWATRHSTVISYSQSEQFYYLMSWDQVK